MATPLAVVSGLTLGHAYSVTVTAVNVIGESAASAPAVVLNTGLAPRRLSGTSAPKR